QALVPDDHVAVLHRVDRLVDVRVRARVGRELFVHPGGQGGWVVGATGWWRRGVAHLLTRAQVGVAEVVVGVPDTAATYGGGQVLKRPPGRHGIEPVEHDGPHAEESGEHQDRDLAD